MRQPRLFQTLLAVLPVLTAGLYLLGLSYHQGYLDAFGIDDTLFPIASDKALFAGFFSLVTLSFPAGLYAIGAIGAFVFLVIVSAVLSSTARVQSMVIRLRLWIARRRPTLSSTPVADVLIDRGATAYAYVSGLVVALLLLLAMAAFSSKTGREQAEKMMDNFSNGKTTVAEVFSPQLPGPLIGKLVMCGEKYCALWSTEGTTVMRHDVVERIVTHSPSRKGAAARTPVPAPSVD